MSTTTPALQPLASVDIQFDPTYSQYKANQLVEALKTAEGTINTLMQRLAALTTQVNGDTGIQVHVLATETGLGPEHTVSGLLAGQVLTATADNSAEFEFLKFTQLSDVDPTSFNDPEQGQVVTWVNGYLALAKPAVLPEDLTQSFITLNLEPTLPSSLPLLQGPGITLTREPGVGLLISANGGVAGLNDIDGGDAISIYLITQDLTGGNSSPLGFVGPPIDGGGA